MAHELIVIGWRLASFREALRDSKSPLFERARDLVADEEGRLGVLRDRLAALWIDPVTWRSGWGAYGLTLLIGLAGALLLRKHARHWKAPPGALEGLWRPWLCVGTISYLWALGHVLWTSVWDETKSWWAWDSWCVSGPSFVSMRVADLGVAAVVSLPIAMGWCLSDRSSVPALAPPVPSLGVRDYVVFLKTWTIVPLISASLLAVAWLRFALVNEYRFDPAYRTVGLGALAAALAVVGRLLHNGYRLRRAYHEYVDRLPVGEAPAPDPTADFLGQEWWKLPASVVATGTTLWLILEALGIARLYLGAVR